MRKNFTPFALAFTVLALLFIAPAGKAQDSYTGTYGTLTEKTNTPMNAVVNGYIEVLPPGYDPNGSTTYPLLIALEGQSQFGDGGVTEIKKLYGNNEGVPADVIKQGLFPNIYTVAGNTYRFIVLIPQVRMQVTDRDPADEKMASPEEMDEIINYALQHYKVDPTRIYLTGLSIGGGTVWNYAGQSTAYANRVAAIVPIAGASNPAYVRKGANRVDNIANSNLPVWTMVNSGDGDANAIPNAQNYINGIQADPQYLDDSKAILTIFNQGGHNAWSAPYKGFNIDNNGKEVPANPTIYEWMLQFTRPSQTAPVFATVNAGTDQSITLSNSAMILTAHGVDYTSGNSITLTGSATANGGHTIASTEWVKVSGNGGTITNPNSLTTTVTGLQPGVYGYQLKVTDNLGVVSTDAVLITVTLEDNSKLLHLEAEDYTSSDKVQVNISSNDEGPANTVTIFPDGWAQYTPTLPSPGKYAVYYRSTGSTSIKFTINGVEKTKPLTGGAGYVTDSLQFNFTTTTPTIRIENVISGEYPSLNYLEFALIDEVTPVNFTFFNAACNGAGVDLLWKTAQEQNSKYFAVQKSTDGTRWNTIATVPAAGQSTTERSYRYTDKNAAANSLYRIAEFDVDGKTTLTAIVKSNCGSKDQLLLYPNPASGDATLSVMLQRPAKVSYWVYDNKGALMFQGLQMLPAGTTALPLATGNFAKGVYTIKVNYNAEVKSLQLVKK